MNKSLSNIEETLLICNNINFSKIYVSVDDFYYYNNLDFLIDANESSLQIVEDDLDLYNSRYVLLSLEIDDFNIESYESFNDFSVSLYEFKNQTDNITKHFEETIQNLSIPFSLISNKTVQKLRILLPDELILNYTKTIEKLNNFYKSYFENIKEVSKYLLSSVKSIYNSSKYLNIKIIKAISDYNKVLGDISKETVHENLKLIKESFIKLQEIVNKSINEIDIIKNKTEKSLEAFKNFDFNYIINTTIYLNDIIFLLKNNYKLDIPYLINSTKINVKNNIINPVIEKSKTILKSLLEIINVDINTSLDLLFIMDIAGSMKNYLEEVKQNILSIINGIIENCPGIDINLWFIGYRDFDEEYIDIDFTQDYAKLKSIISNVTASGGNNIPEDVAFVLELTLKKSWKSDARLAFLVTDAPAHGVEYGGDKLDSEIMPERRLIEEMIAEMAEKNISLFCLNLL